MGTRLLFLANGRFITFASDASNLVPSGQNSVGDIFLYGVATRKLEIVNLSNQ
ncbi:MAG: hypothetical protein GY805_04760 [Chloroflexi bacterium]|nr:hypothetical protein [Chloroflexota bacterium]